MEMIKLTGIRDCFENRKVARSWKEKGNRKSKSGGDWGNANCRKREL
jgi:hypothetical protein